MIQESNIAVAVVAQSLLSAPGWARVGLTMRDERTRTRAADELARSVIASLDDEVADDADQLTLAL